MQPSQLLTNIQYQFDTLAKRYYHNGALYYLPDDFNGNKVYESVTEKAKPADTDGRFFDYDGVTGVQVIRIIRRIATREWKRPYIRLSFYQHRASPGMHGTIQVPKRKRFESTVAPLMLAVGDGVADRHVRTYWYFIVGPEIWPGYLHHFITDPELRRARGIPDDVPPLLEGVTQ